MKTRSRCQCGKVKSKHANKCKGCIQEAKEKTAAVVESGKCPLCSSGLRCNLAIVGWWQCEQYGAETDRANPEAPACSWQGFTK